MLTRALHRMAAPLWLAPSLALAQPAAPAASPVPESGEALAPAKRQVSRAPFTNARDPMEIFVDSLELIEREYVDGDVNRDELIEAALRGVVDHLNRKAQRAGHPGVNALLSRREVGRLTDSLSGEATGIGVLARPVSAGGIEVLRVFSHSPAGKAGLRPGDRIAAIDDRPVAGLEAFGLLRGDDGAPVRLSIVRGSGDAISERLDVKVVRSRYRVAAVESSEIEGDLGYLKVLALPNGASEDVAGALLEYQHAQYWGVILDLRGNPGGSLEEATRIAEMFVSPGRPLLQIQTSAREPQLVTAGGELLWNGPLTVLVDGGTSSAAEALAAALQANGSLLVGDRTAGRGLGESVFALPTGGALRLATARYRTPEGKSWIGGGLIPNISVPAGASLDPSETLDPQLRNAVIIMQSQRPRPRYSPEGELVSQPVPQ